MSHTPRNIQGGYTAADFWTQWSSVTPRMCICMLVTPRVGTALGFTSNTRDMTLPGHVGITFRSTPAITPTVVEQVLDEPTNLELTGLYTSDSFDQTEVLAGKYNFAEIEIFSVCWNNVNLGEFLHFRGNLGEMKDYQTFFTAEARGLISRLSNDAHSVTSRFCRVKEFRDAQCGHTAATVTVSAVAYNTTQTNVTGTAFSVGDQHFGAIFDTSAWAGNDPSSPNLAAFMLRYANGKITATSGDNNGVSREISVMTEATGGHPYVNIITKRPFPFVIDTSTTFNLVMGCNRTIEDCMIYSNIVNRRAEDWIPGIEAANKINESN